MQASSPLRCVVIGEGTLPVRCSEHILARGMTLLGVVSPDPAVERWAKERGAPFFWDLPSFGEATGDAPFDVLVSAVNNWILPDALVARARVLTANFHDSPLPRYAGRFATSWALMAQETEHAISWHQIATKVDAGDVYVQRPVPIYPEDTAFTLNGRCYDAAINGFEDLLGLLVAGKVEGRPQDLSQRTFFGVNRRPAGAAFLRWSQPATTLEALVRALDFGLYPNPLSLPKLLLQGRVVCVRAAQAVPGRPSVAPGTVLAAEADALTVACGEGALRLTALVTQHGRPVPMAAAREGCAEGSVLAEPLPEQLEAAQAALALCAPHETFWLGELEKLSAATHPLFTGGARSGAVAELPLHLGEALRASAAGEAGLARVGAALVGYLARFSVEDAVTLGYRDPALVERFSAHPQLFPTQVPLHLPAHAGLRGEELAQRFSERLAKVRKASSFPRDLVGRYAKLRAHPLLSGEAIPFTVGIEPAETPGSSEAAVTVRVSAQGEVRLAYDTGVLPEAEARRFAAQLERLLVGTLRSPGTAVSRLELLSEAEREAELSAGRGEEVSVWGGSFAEKFAEVAKARGDAPAVRCGAETLTYAELLKRARGCGEALREAGVKEESLVALLGQRGAGLVTAILGVWEAGGAYLPLDPEHPAKRVRQILEGSGASVVVVGDGERALLDEALAGMEKPPAVLKLEEVTRRERQQGLGVKRARQALSYVIYTSGSTGEPKGVMVEEEGMVNHLEAKVRELSLGAGEVVAQNASQCFDISVWQMLVGLWVGGVTEVLGKEEAASPRGLMEVVEERGVTVLEVVPSMLKAMVEEVEGGKKPGFEKLRWLVATGEALSPQTCGRWLEEYPGIPVVNAYGPTECSDDVTHAFLKEAPKGANAPVGKALPNLQTWVLGKELEVMPVGVPGELHVGGVGVGRGYLGRPDLTAERFVPDPYGEPGARLYRTGDLVKRLADGSVEYLGRVDHQVKVRGFRIELGEIEKVLGKVEGVKDCVVVALGEGGDKQLVGYVVGEVEASDVKAALRERLPEYMVPSAVVRLEALPLTANGKVDRKKLPAPEGGMAAEYVAPRSPLEELVAQTWAGLLKLDRVGAHDDFFVLGGQSLTGAQAVGRLTRALGQVVPLRMLFEHSTVSGLAEALEAQQGAARRFAPLVAQPVKGAFPLSPAQEWFWFLYLMDPSSPVGNSPLEARLEGAVDPDALRAAVADLGIRHPMLRARISTEDGRPVQVFDDAAGLTLEVVDLRAQPSAEAEALADERIQQEVRRPFDLAKGAICRALLVQLPGEVNRLTLVMNHMVSDRESMEILCRDLSALYRARRSGQAPSLAPVPVSYADFSRWQRQRFDAAEEEGRIEYWRKTLAGAETNLELPADVPASQARSFGGAIERFRLTAEQVQGMRALCRASDTTLYMGLLAAYAVLLHRHSGQEGFLLGTPFSGREQPGTEGLVGYLVDTLVLRMNLAGAPGFRDLLNRVRETVLGAHANRDVSLEAISAAVQPAGEARQTVLLQSSFSFRYEQRLPLTLDGVRSEAWIADTGASIYPIELEAWELPDGSVEAQFLYNVEVFRAPSVRRLADQFAALVADAASHPDRPVGGLEILSARAREEVLTRWNLPGTPAPEVGVHQLVEAQVARTPDAPALQHGEITLTYRQLEERANQLAHHLLARGLRPEERVAVFVRPCCEAIIALLAVLKAGGAYVPLDIEAPAERITYSLEDAEIRFVLTERALVETIRGEGRQLLELDHLFEGEEAPPTHAPGLPCTPSSLAYVVYTSGSTGEPKGVLVQHGSVVNHVTAVAKRFGLRPEDRVLQFTPINFDAAGEEIYPTLTRGACCVIRGELVPSLEFRDLLEAERLSVLSLPPAYLHECVGELKRVGQRIPPCVRLVLLGGEKLLPETIKLWREVGGAQVPILNVYGPTEATVTAALCEIGAEATWLDAPTLPIGTPIANARIYLLDAAQRPVPFGRPGEVYIAGAGLARGYLNRADQTAERFLPDPFTATPGARMYRTGDLARAREDGLLEFVGRVDHQVKIRGFRIELGEIESRLRKLPGVQEALCLAREDQPGNPRLVAYVVKDGAELDVASLREALARALPAYMVPSAFVQLDAFPLTSNGKVDRKALPAPDLQAESRAYVPPANPTQTALVEIWQSALGLPRVGVEDNFFELGGHSLTATQVVSRIRESLQVELPLRHVFEQPTIAALAEVISTLPKLEVVRLPEEVDEMSEDQVDAMLRELIAGRAVSE